MDEAIRFVCNRRGFRGEEAEDFRSHVHLKLVESDFRVFRKFQGRSSLRTYLITVVNRVGLDYLIAQKGKWRPSAKALRMGPLAVQLEELTYRRGHSLSEAGEILRTNKRIAIPAGTLSDMLAQLPVRPGRSFVDTEALVELPHGGPNADRQLVAETRARERQSACRQLEAVLSDLSVEDRLLVRLRYEKGLQVAAIARSLGVRQKPLYARLARILGQLKQMLEERGVSAELVRELFEEE